MIAKTIRMVALATMLLGVNSLTAGSFFGNSCDSSNVDCCGCWEWGVWFDPMAVKPCQMPLEYVDAEVPTTENQTDKTDYFLMPDWEWGFRVGGGISPECGNWNTRLDFHRWENKSGASQAFTGVADRDTLVEPVLATENDFGAFAVSLGDTFTVATSLNYEFNQLDWTFGYDCCFCQGLGFQPYAGFRALWYKTDVSQTITDSTGAEFSTQGDVSSVSNSYNAYGFVGGVRWTYNICDCINFYGRFGGSFVGGQNTFSERFVKSETEEETTTTTVITDSEDICLFVHNYEGEFGVTYDLSLCDTEFVLGLGYQVQQWNEVLPHPFRENRNFEGSATKTSNGLFTQAIVVRLGGEF